MLPSFTNVSDSCIPETEASQSTTQEASEAASGAASEAASEAATTTEAIEASAQDPSVKPLPNPPNPIALWQGR